ESYKDEPATQLAYIERGQDIWSKNKLTNIYSISNVGNRGIIYINLYQNDSLRNQMPTQFTLHGTSLLQAAERDLKEAIELAKSAGNQEQLMNFYQAYHRVLAEKGEYKAALEALRHSY